MKTDSLKAALIFALVASYAQAEQKTNPAKFTQWFLSQGAIADGDGCFTAFVDNSVAYVIADKDGVFHCRVFPPGERFKGKFGRMSNFYVLTFDKHGKPMERHYEVVKRFYLSPGSTEFTFSK